MTPATERGTGVLGHLRSITARPLGTASSLSLLVFTLGTILTAAVQRHSEYGGGAQRFYKLDLGAAFAAAAVASLLLGSSGPGLALARVDLAVLLACALAWFLPESHAVYLGMTLAGLWLVARTPRGCPSREVGQVWLALSLCQLWGKLAFKMSYQALVPIEAALMASVGRLAFPGLEAAGARLSANADWTVVVLEGCSAFHNLSLAALLWLCVLRIAGRRVDAGALVALAVSAGLVVAINVARLLAMLPSLEAYRFWHDGPGSVVVAASSAVAALAPVVIRIERGSRSERAA